MRLVINKKAAAISFLIILLVSECALLNAIPAIRYADEIITIIAFIYLLLRKISLRGQSTNAEISSIFNILTIACILGFAGNVINKVTNSYLGIAVDFLGVIKIFVAFAFAYYYLPSGSARLAAVFLGRLSKLLIWLATIFGIISIFINLGMSGEERFGLCAYSFIFHHSHILAIICMCGLMFISATEVSDRTINFYTFLVCICQILTTKGPSIIWTVIVWLLFRYFVKNRKIKPWLIVILAIIAVALGQYQIRNYFGISTAPRALLLRYGIYTAKRYFPLGTGFATYGSEMAKRNYSRLYYEYGFNVRWGMTIDDGRFLNDNYWPMIMAQFGYIGLILFIIMFIIYFRAMQRYCGDKKVKALLIATFIYAMLLSLGSAFLTGMEGTLLFLTFGVILAMYKSE